MKSDEPNTTCSSCGTEMTCGYQAGCSVCWCFELPHAIKLSASQEGCFCRDCLTQKISEQPQPEQPQLEQPQSVANKQLQ